MNSDAVSQQLLLMGLPKAGKTTFVAALWHVLSSEEVQNTLTVAKLGGDDEYLNTIRDSWISYEPLGRTSQQNESVPSMDLLDVKEGRRSLLLVPDLSGETYRSQWVDREWTERFEALAANTTGILLFVHPEQNIEPTEITTTQRLLPPMDDEGASDQKVKGAHPQTEIPKSEGDATDIDSVWDPERANDVVQLVDTLQAFEERHDKPLRISVIVSAWDLVKEYFDSPDDFLQRKLSLLDQYLKSNPSRFTYSVFGVSATGVSLDDEEACSTIQENTNRASERIEVSDGVTVDHDITRPIRWVLQW